ncbi:MAG: CARDB domain-containing protein [Armatimonadota bacterium]
MFSKMYPQGGRRWLPVTGLAVAFSALAAVGPRPAVAELPARLQITSIGDLNGMQTFASGINDAGVVVGYAAATGSHLPVRWSNGTLTQIPSGISGGVATDVNNQDQVVGHLGGARPQAVLYGVNGPQELNTLGAQQSYAAALNDLTQVVGWYRMPESDFDLPYLWQNGTMAALALPANTSEGLAVAISNSGYVAGYALDGDFLPYPVRWSQSLEPAVLPGPGGTVVMGQASGVNDAGDVSGSIITDGWQRPVVWRNGQPIIIDDLPDAVAGHAVAVNNLGQVLVSAVTVGNDELTFLWEDLNGNGESDPGEAVNLSTLLPQPSAWRLVQVTGLSDTGRIAGWGRLNGSVRGFVLTPAGAPQPDLSLEITPAPLPARVGQELTYTVTIRNQGEADATNSALVVTLPDTAELVSGNPSPVRATNGALVFGFDTLAAGATANATLTVRPEELGELDVQFTAVSAQNDAQPGNNNMSVVVEVLEAAPAGVDLALELSEVAPLPGRTGKPLTFTFTVTNSGVETAQGAQLIVGPLSGAKFVESKPKAKEHNGHYLIKLGSLSAGASKTVTFEVRPTREGSFHLSASANSQAEEANLENNNVETFLGIEGPARPDLTVSLGEITTATVGRGRKRKPGLQMPVTVTNLGAAAVKFKKPLVVEYYFSTDDQLDAGDLRLGKSTVSGKLQAHPHPRDSKSFTAKVALPLDFDPSQLPEGYLLAKVDASDKVAESNEENNVGSQVLVIAD